MKEILWNAADLFHSLLCTYGRDGSYRVLNHFSADVSTVFSLDGDTLEPTSSCCICLLGKSVVLFSCALIQKSLLNLTSSLSWLLNGSWKQRQQDCVISIFHHMTIWLQGPTVIMVKDERRGADESQMSWENIRACVGNKHPPDPVGAEVSKPQIDDSWWVSPQS